MPPPQRKTFSNLILLCFPHHVIVDKRRPQEFPATTLEQWKADRERGHEAALSRIGDVTAEQLQDVLASAIKERDEILHRTLERLEQSDAEAAELLRGLVDEVADLRQARYLDMTEDFARAAHQLYQMYSDGALEDFVDAARRLPEQ